MTRLIEVLLSVLVALVALHTFIVWRAGEQAHRDAERAQAYDEHQACLARTQSTVVVALIAPALITPPRNGEDRATRLESLQELSAQLDQC